MIDSLLLKEFESIGVRYEQDWPLADACTFKIGGRCALALFPNSAEQIALCVDMLDRRGEPFCVVGRGSNTLFFDGYVDKALIFTSGASSVRIDGEYVIAEAGVALIPLCARLARESLGGMEFAAGIPGSVGGAMYMNAGAYGRDMSDVVVSSRAFDRKSGSIVTVQEHGFGYRQSIYQRESGLICLEARLRLTHADKQEILATMRALSEQRRSKQPLEYPSAGSYFKRPDGDFAGRLIEVSGLKGTACGGACVSEKHAGFIINLGGATFDDVVSLEKLVVERVLENTGVLLEREVEIIK